MVMYPPNVSINYLYAELDIDAVSQVSLPYAA